MTARHKFRNIPTEVDGIRFDSQREARRWTELRLLERAGEIQNLRRQPSYPLYCNGVKVATYRADYAYERPDGSTVIEDVKSPATRAIPVYRLKAKMMAAQGTPIVEV